MISPPYQSTNNGYLTSISKTCQCFFAPFSLLLAGAIFFLTIVLHFYNMCYHCAGSILSPCGFRIRWRWRVSIGPPVFSLFRNRSPGPARSITGAGVMGHRRVMHGSADDSAGRRSFRIQQREGSLSRNRGNNPAPNTHEGPFFNKEGRMKINFIARIDHDRCPLTWQRKR